MNQLCFTESDEWPEVVVLMAAYNEELLIAQKLDSLLSQDYPGDKLTIFIGSDASTDKTDSILSRYAEAHSHLHFVPFSTRTGKPGIINTLVERVQDAMGKENVLFLMTDASVILEESVTRILARHFKNPEIGMVDAHMRYIGVQSKGISNSENTYLSGEVQLKNNESIAWGRMIGPFGGCFMMRADFFEPVPSNFLVDDFYLAMKVLEQGKLVINDLDAKCDEPVTHQLKDEFRRKKRISAGNFQNLYAFKHLTSPFNLTGFAFLSHKVLRWKGPFYMIIILACSALLACQGSSIGLLLMIAQLVWYILAPAADWLLSMAGIHISILRHIRYFNLMNVALLAGFVKFVSGVSTNVWQPTSRD